MAQFPTAVAEPGQDSTLVLNMGPQHPSTHGVLRLVLEIDGETVVRLKPEIGFLHTGIEKTCEAKFYQQVVPLTDRIDYLCPLTNNLCYCLAVEKLLALEIPLGFFEKVKKFADRFPGNVDEYEGLLTGNPIFVMRTKGVAHLSAEDAIALGACGPTLRGSGVDIDLRRDAPYSGYENFKFNVPVRTEGDVFARYLCRVQELRESIGMVQQALAGMPDGPVKADAPKVVLPDREKMKTQMEALIYHFKIITEGFTVPAGEVYQAIESPRGEMGYYVVSDGTAKPYRVHMRGPSYANLQTLAKMCEGQLIADVVAAIGSIDVVLGDIDR